MTMVRLWGDAYTPLADMTMARLWGDAYTPLADMTAVGSSGEAHDPLIGVTGRSCRPAAKRRAPLLAIILSHGVAARLRI